MNRGSETARTLNGARRVGYAILPGDGFSYVLHMRPREWPIMAAHTALGFVLALGLASVARGTKLGTLVAALVIWVIFLNGGTLALNSAFDRDQGDIGYLDAPPPPPRYLAWFGAGLMFVGQVLALLLPRTFAVLYAVCIAMSVLYSVPPMRLKAVPGADWIINMVGFGALTPLAGWAATGKAVSAAGAWVLFAFGNLFAALYPLTQLYQVEEDTRRGDRTLARLLGIRGSLQLSLAAALAAWLCFARAAVLARVQPWQWLALGVGAVSWATVLLRWLWAAPGMMPDEHKRGMYLSLTAWAVTDGAVVLAFA